MEAASPLVDGWGGKNKILTPGGEKEVIK